MIRAISSSRKRSPLSKKQIKWRAGIKSALFSYVLISFLFGFVTQVFLMPAFGPRIIFRHFPHLFLAHLIKPAWMSGTPGFRHKVCSASKGYNIRMRVKPVFVALHTIPSCQLCFFSHAVKNRTPRTSSRRSSQNVAWISCPRLVQPLSKTSVSNTRSQLLSRKLSFSGSVSVSM